MAEGLSALLGGRHELRLIDEPSELPTALTDDAAVLMLTHVNYRTGYMHDMKAVDRKSTRLNSSHITISYAVFCLKKKKYNEQTQTYYRVQN